MNITYKETTLDDLQAILESEKIASKSTYYLAYTTESDVKKYLSNSHVYIIYLDDDLVGHVSYKEIDRDTVEVDGLVVLPTYRKRGIASKAVKMIVTKMGRYKQAELVTHPHNIGSLLIYLRNGFVIDSWIDNPFGDDEPRVKLIKSLK